MPQYLLTVEDTFFIEGRGTILVPDIDLGMRPSCSMRIELRMRASVHRDRQDRRIVITKIGRS